ncbi:hypothetical protein V8F20_010134 [Naviculisporaceae sp. PSN 640]
MPWDRNNRERTLQRGLEQDNRSSNKENQPWYNLCSFTTSLWFAILTPSPSSTKQPEAGQEKSSPKEDKKDLPSAGPPKYNASQGEITPSPCSKKIAKIAYESPTIKKAISPLTENTRAAKRNFSALSAASDETARVYKIAKEDGNNTTVDADAVFRVTLNAIEAGKEALETEINENEVANKLLIEEVKTTGKETLVSQVVYALLRDVQFSLRRLQLVLQAQSRTRWGLMVSRHRRIVCCRSD